MGEEKQEILKANLNYSQLRNIITEHFKTCEGEELITISLDRLRPILKEETQEKFFIIKNDLGETRFNISKEDIKKILQMHISPREYEILDLQFGDDITYSYKYNLDVSKLPTPNLDITYDGKMDYSDLRKIIVDYYRKTKGIELRTISIDYFKNILNGQSNIQFFITGNDERFNIPKEEIEKILSQYLYSMNCDFISVNYGDKVEFKYKKRKPETIINEKGEIIRLGGQNNKTTESKNDIPQFEPPKENTTQESTIDDLTRMKKEDRKFTILRRERAMNDAATRRNRSAILAGLCILGAGAAAYFSGGQDIQQLVQEEIAALSSWEAAKQYIHDIGPLATGLAASAAAFFTRYLRNSRRLRDLRNESIDFNDSLEGGNENVRAR